MKYLFDKIKANIPFGILLVLMLILHIRMNLALSDDANFSLVLSEKSIFEHMKNLYINVNGKIWPDTMAAIFTYISPWWFKCFDSIIYVIMAYCISYVLFDNTMRGKVIICIIMLYFPYSILTSAGYVATSTNYIWTTTALFIVLLGIKKAMQNEIHLSFYIVFTIAALYAANQEQTGVIGLICLTSELLVILIKKEKVPFLIIYGLILETVTFMLMLTAPGHVKRTQGYSIFRIPNYPQLDFVDKIYLGLTTTIAHYLSWKSITFIVFSIILINVVWKKRIEKFYRILSIFPLATIIFMNLIPKIKGMSTLTSILHFNFEWGYNQETFAIIDASNFDQMIAYFPVFVCGMLIVSILISFFVISDSIKDFLVYLILMGFGFASRMIMAFSPTLFGSSIRTHTYLYICIICICAYMIYKNENTNFFLKGIIIIGAAISFCYSYVGIIK